jgi:bifunctional DNA-binding transcriptional regulator/antitoxin component of YhaV-PrlF toxin-antitoxin module
MEFFSKTKEKQALIFNDDERKTIIILEKMKKSCSLLPEVKIFYKKLSKKWKKWKKKDFQPPY